MFYWIYDYPTLWMGALFALAFILVTWLAIFLFRRYFRSWFHSERRANDMVGFVFSSFAVLYGILVGLVAVAAYQSFDNVNDLATREASTLAAVYRDLGGYPETVRARLQGQLRNYTRYEIDVAWPQQQRGIVPGEGTHRLEQFMDDLLSFRPSNLGEQIIHAELLRQLNSLMDLRSARLSSVTEGIPAALWWVVGIGALISVMLLAMLDMEIHVHLILGAALALFLGLIIYLIAEMDNPYRGRVSVTPEAFETVYHTIMVPDEVVDKAIAALIVKTDKLGAPHLEGTQPVAGKRVPGLYFGQTLVNNSFDVVDQVVREHGGTATLFVKAGDEYVRVSTTIRKSDGSRAIGTILDPSGPAIARIRNAEAYYGEATILGNPYVTGYEPIKDTYGNVIGIYYAGYRKSPEAVTGGAGR